jgi:hypothetical protein
MDAVIEFYSLDVKSPIIHVGFDEKYLKKLDELRGLEESLLSRSMI